MAGNGKSVRVAVTGRYRRDGDGRLDGAVLALRPIERRNTLAASGVEVVSTVSHELRSPLTSVKGYTSLLLNRWDRLDDDQKRSMLEQVQHDADRVTRLITELLDISRLETGRLRLRCQMVDIAALAEVVVEKVRIGHPELSVSVSFPGELPRVYADPDKVEQVLTNLLENAAKYADSPDVRVEGVYDEGRKAAHRSPSTTWARASRRPSFPGCSTSSSGAPRAAGRAGRASASTSPGVWWRPTAGASPPRAGWARGRPSPSPFRPTPSRRPSATETAARDAGELTALLDAELARATDQIDKVETAADLDEAERTFLGKRSAAPPPTRASRISPPTSGRKAGQAVSAYKAGGHRTRRGPPGGARRRRRRGRRPARPHPPRAGSRPGPPPPDHPGAAGAGGGLPRPRLRGGRRPRGRDRLLQLRGAQHAAGPPGPVHVGHALRQARPARRSGAAHAHLPGADPGHGVAPAARLHGDARPLLPARHARRPPLARSSTRSRASSSTRASPSATWPAPSTPSPGPTSAPATRPGCGPATSPSPNRAPSSRSPASSATAPAARSAPRPGWLELGGCGMVDPNVFRAVGYDSETLHRLRLRLRAGADGHGPLRRRAHQVVLRERHPVPQAVLAEYDVKAPLSWLRDFAPIEGHAPRTGRPAQRDRPHRRGHRTPRGATSPASARSRCWRSRSTPTPTGWRWSTSTPATARRRAGRVRRPQLRRRRHRPLGAARGRAARRLQAGAAQDPGRGVGRDALRPRRARPVRRPQRDHDPAARHAARGGPPHRPRPRRHRLRPRDHPQPARRHVDRRRGPRPGRRPRRAVHAAGAGRSRRHRPRPGDAGRRGPRPLPSLRGQDRAGGRGPVPRLDGAAPDQGRHAADLQRRRRHQLRDAGAGPAPARLRPRPPRRPGDRRPPGQRRREDHHPRRRRAHAVGRRPPDLRRQPGAPGHRRRDGRRRLRGLRRHHRAAAGVGLLHRRRDPPHLQAPRAADGVVGPLRARRRPQRHRSRRRPGLGAVRRDRLRPGRPPARSTSTRRPIEPIRVTLRTARVNDVLGTDLDTASDPGPPRAAGLRSRRARANGGTSSTPFPPTGPTWSGRSTSSRRSPATTATTTSPAPCPA